MGREAQAVDPLVRDALDGDLLELIGLTGEAGFENKLLMVVQATTGCEHLSAVAFDGKGPPRLLAAAGAVQTAGAGDVTQRYVDSYWRNDPLNHQAAELGREGRGVSALRAEEISNAPYRWSCFTKPAAGARFSVVQRHGDAFLRLSFYADRRSGGFTDPQRERMAHWAELLLALIVKHDRLVRAEARAETGSGERGRAVKARLLQAAPGLSDREAEVCALIAQGCGSEAIGLQLGISINTVKTYRRRAYGRLRISTQNELLRLALS